MPVFAGSRRGTEVMSSTGTPAQPRKAWLVVRALIGATLLALLTAHVDWIELGRALAGIELGWAAAGSCALLGMRLVAGLKWHLLLRGLGTGARLADTVRMVFVSDFLGHFLPYGVGADATRVVQLARAGSGWSASLSSVIMDRIVGSWVLLSLGAAALLASPVRLPNHTILLAAVLGMLAVSIAAFIVAAHFHDRAAALAGRIPIVGPRLSAFLAGILGSLDAYRTSRRVLAATTALGFAIHLLRIVMNAAFAVALGFPLSLWVHAVAVPIIFSVSQLPISIDALGVREALYLYIYGLAGMPAAIALAVALIIRGCGYLLSIPGAALYVRHGFGGRKTGVADSEDGPDGTTRHRV